MSTTTPVLSRPVLAVSIPDDGTHMQVEATPAERLALARTNDLVALHRLSGAFDLKPQKRGGGIVVQGSVSATVVQTCTVSLDEFESEIREEVDLVFMPPERAAAWAEANKARTKAESEPGLADEDPPDLIIEGRIDLGVVTAEYLSLGIDPYPRKPGVAFEAPAGDADKDPSPFAALAKLRKEP